MLSHALATVSTKIEIQVFFDKRPKSELGAVWQDHGSVFYDRESRSYVATKVYSGQLRNIHWDTFDTYDDAIDYLDVERLYR